LFYTIINDAVDRGEATPTAVPPPLLDSTRKKVAKI